MGDERDKWFKGVKMLLDAAVKVEERAAADDPKSELGHAVVPHGAHPRNKRLVEYRARYFGYNLPLAPSDADASPGWGCWATMKDVSRLQPVMPPAYIECARTVQDPAAILCGKACPSDADRAAVCEALEETIAEFIHLMLVIQLEWLDMIKKYDLLSRDSIHRAAALSLLRKGPTAVLGPKDQKEFQQLCQEKVAPFRDELQVYDRPSLLQFFEQHLGTLFVFGVPVISTRVSMHEPGWRNANTMLERVGSKLRVRLCVLGSSTELLLGELLLDKCSTYTVFVGRERARTAMLALEVASTQDTAENPTKMYREESIEFVCRHKWDLDRIEKRDWNIETYGPTQKLVVEILRAMTGDNKLDMRAFMRGHFIESLFEYQAGETMVNTDTFTPEIRGILHALFSRHVLAEDMHSLLVDTVKRPTEAGILVSVLKQRVKSLDRSRVRLLMYVTDVWFSADRLYTWTTFGALCACLCQTSNGMIDLNIEALEAMFARLFQLTAATLTRIAENTRNRFMAETYRVLSHDLPFSDISRILTNQYRRNDGHVDEASLKFHSSFWMNIMGYYIRLTNGKAELLDSYVYREVHAFLDEVAAIFAERNPQLAALLPKSIPGEDDDAGAAGLKNRLKTGFRFFEKHWDGFVRSTYDRVAEQNRLRALVASLRKRLDDDEPDAKRPRTEKK